MLAALAGCSLGLSGPDPQRPARQLPRCDTGKGSVLTDGLIATTAGVAATSLALDHDIGALIPAVIGAVFVGALIHGNSVVDECRRDHDKYTAELAVPVAPQEPEPVVVETPAPAPSPPVLAPATWAAFWKEVR